ncbi:MAG: cell division protein ZapD [Succinivibrionaceae bacterium]|nr:cell division protein ZapD [Succinivibrionaceae bacterium]
MLVFDFPMNPKARTYLKFEDTFKRAEDNREIKDLPQTMALIRAVIDYIDLVDGAGALKIDIQKDLEKIDAMLRTWQQDPESDPGLLGELRERISESRAAVGSFTRQHTVLQTDPLIETIKPRIMTPCGINCFDTPLFVFWMTLKASERQACAGRWLQELNALRTPIVTILYLWRLCANYQRRVAQGGFIQETTDPCDIIEIKYPSTVRGYPVVSGFQSNINVRFMPYEKGATVGDIEFELAYLRSSLQ